MLADQLVRRLGIVGLVELLDEAGDALVDGEALGQLVDVQAQALVDQEVGDLVDQGRGTRLAAGLPGLADLLPHVRLEDAVADRRLPRLAHRRGVDLVDERGQRLVTLLLLRLQLALAGRGLEGVVLADDVLQQVEHLGLAQALQHLAAQVHGGEGLRQHGQEVFLQLGRLQEPHRLAELGGVHVLQLRLLQLADELRHLLQAVDDHPQGLLRLLYLGHDLADGLAQQDTHARGVAHDVGQGLLAQFLPAVLAQDVTDEALVLEFFGEALDLFLAQLGQGRLRLAHLFLFLLDGGDLLVVGDGDVAALVHQDVLHLPVAQRLGQAALGLQLLRLLRHDLQEGTELLRGQALGDGDAEHVAAPERGEEGDHRGPRLVLLLQPDAVDQQEVVGLAQAQLAGPGDDPGKPVVTRLHRGGDHVAGGGVHVDVDHGGVESYQQLHRLLGKLRVKLARCFLARPGLFVRHVAPLSALESYSVIIIQKRR